MKPPKRTPVKELQEIAYPILFKDPPPTDRDIVQCLTNVAITQRLEIRRLKLALKDMAVCL